MIKKTFNDSDEFSLYLKTNKTEFFDSLILNIKKCLDENLMSIKIADVRLIEENVNLDISIELNNSMETLDFAEQHYVETEQYEKCEEIKKIKTLVKKII